MRCDHEAIASGSFFCCSAGRSGAIFSSPSSIDQQNTSVRPCSREISSNWPSSLRKAIRSAWMDDSGASSFPGCSSWNLSGFHFPYARTIAPFFTFMRRPSRASGTTSCPLKL